ncbi:MAG: septal ring lytic transglycosylase RlpA family protein [Candidatus Gastranaerophilales bacterium]|nr:septal ring lytic transglycosylase RlpA family protein [Candidatus Gastranaerophilales bacterium]
MIKKIIWQLSFIVLVLAVSFTTFAYGNTKIALNSPLSPLIDETVKNYTINYKNLSNNKGSVVYINGKQVTWFLTGFDNLTAEQRAKLFISRFNEFIENGGSIEKLIPIKNKSNTLVQTQDFFLAVADKQNADKFGISTHQLACHWINSIRKAFDLEIIVNDYSYFVDENKKPLKELRGVASWYGGSFHGRTSSDGSRFNKYEFTAAHKSLPFGSLVRVTNLVTNKQCVVKITDRGPFVGNRIIDLSFAAAKQIGVYKSGTSRVKLELLGRYE